MTTALEVGGELLDVGEREDHCDHVCLQGLAIYDSKRRIYIKPIFPWGYTGFDIALQVHRHLL